MLVAGVLCVAASPGGAAETDATQVVSRLNAALLDVLKQAEALGYQGRFDRLAPAMSEAFDIDFMAEKSLGRYWKTLADGDRRRWLDVFREFSVANYAGNFDHYAGQSFVLLGEEPGAADTTVVHTRIAIPGGENVELTYRLHQSDVRWKIVDVYLKGTVSELALRRSDYTSVLERQSFDALLITLRRKIADLAAGRGKRQGP